MPQSMAELQPYWPFIIMALNGFLAGWLASLLLGGGGLIRNIVVGLLGAFIGGVLVRAGFLDPRMTTGYAYVDQIVVSTIGAAIVILIARFLGGR